MCELTWILQRRASLAACSHTNNCLNRFDNQEMTRVHMFLILSANMFHRGQLRSLLQKGLKIASGVSGAEAEKVCGCLSCLPKATASLRFGLSESSEAMSEWRFLFCVRIFCKKTVHNMYQVSKYNKANFTPACVHISCCEFWILNSILSKILPI